MHKLFTIRFGSHLYGTNTENSDIDLKTIYLPNLSDLLLGRKPEIFKKRLAGENESTLPGEVEEEFIPIQTFAAHFLDNQSYALEVTFAFLSETNIEYINEPLKRIIITFVEHLHTIFLNKSISHILGYCLSQSQKYGLKGKRLDEIQKLIEYLELDLGPTYPLNGLTIKDIASRFDEDNSKVIYITKIKASRAGEEQMALAIGNKTFAFNTTLKHFLNALKKMQSKYGERSLKSLDGHDWKALSHSIRICHQTIELLSTNKITFPSAIKDHLLDIKLGKIEEEIVYSELSELFNKVQELLDQSQLPEKDFVREHFDFFLKDWMYEFYGI
jgi:hypothetical protein